MRWTSAVSDAPSFTEAVHQVCDQALEAFDGQHPDLALVFVSAHHGPSYYSVPEIFAERLGPKLLAGCSAAGVIGAGREIERRSGVAISAALLPGVGVKPFHVQSDHVPTADESPDAWVKLVGLPASECRALLLLPDPFSVEADQLIAGLDYAYPKAVKMGGLVSGGNGPGANALFLGNKVLRSGAIGLAFSGDLAVETVVAQGCRPVGRPMVITECERNVIKRLDDEAPLDIVRDLFEKGETRERRLIRRSLQIGVLMDPLSDSFSAGDFLIRNVIGAEEKDGSIAIGELVREGQVVQFHVRDAEAADEDLRAMLERYSGNMDGAEPASALLFQCLGRGQYLFGQPDHDTGLFRDMVAPVPLAGFFCNGEIGPVGESTFLHGYTSSFALFRHEKSAAAR